MSRSKVFLRVNRINAEVCARAEAVTVSDLHEGAMQHGISGLMFSRMAALQKQAKVAGPAVTALCAPGDNLMMHRALYLAQPGDILVIVCPDETSGSQWGDMATRYALRKGIKGVVIQGCARDTDTVSALGFPVWATHVHSARPDKQGHGQVNMPIMCGGVLVHPGDLILADGDGVICIPKHQAETVLRSAYARMEKEAAMEEKIEAGASMWDLSGAALSYAEMHVDEIDAAYDD